MGRDVRNQKTTPFSSDPDETQSIRVAFAFRLLVAERDHAESAAAVIIVAGSEEQLVVIAIRAAALAELNRPNVVDLDCLALGVAERAKVSAGLGIVGVDAPTRRIIRDEKRIAHGPEVGRSKRDAPRRVEIAAHGEVSKQNASGSEGVHKAALRLVQGSVSDPNRFGAIRVGNRLNAVGSELPRNVRVGKSIRTKIREFEAGVEYVDPAVRAAIGGVQEFLSIVGGDGQAGVRGADRRSVSGN